MSELRFYKKRRKVNYDLIRSVLIWIFDIAVIFVIAFVLVQFMGKRVNTIGNGMEPALENGDQVLVNKVAYMLGTPKRNDIIIFKPNGNENAQYYIRRIIGLPGETIQITENTIYINGEALTEEFETSQISESGIAEDLMVLGSDEYFVMGDNRISTEDSRLSDIGPVSRDHIEGKAWFIISPKDKLGFIK